MAVTGKDLAITNRFDSYVSQPDAPGPETFAPLPNARVRLRSGLVLISLSVEVPDGHDGADRGWSVT